MQLLCTAQISRFQPKIVNICSRMNNEFSIVFIFCVEFCKISANFYEILIILSGFRDKFLKRMTCVAFSIKFAKTNWKIAENSEIRFCKNYSLLFIIFETSFASLAAPPRPSGRPPRAPRRRAPRGRRGSRPEGCKFRDFQREISKSMY